MKFAKTALFVVLLLTISLALAAPKEFFLDAGDSVEVNNKTITLVNVGEGGAIVIDVDEVLDTISAHGTKTVNGIIITNKETFYTNEKSERSAAIEVTFPEVDELCSNGLLDAVTEEEDIDCGGYCDICETCSDGIKNQDETDVDCGGDICEVCSIGMTCEKDSDCLTDECYKDECIKCTKFIEPECPNGELISKGKEDGCHLGYTCCGDSLCSEWEDENNCEIDCKIEEVNKEIENEEVCYDGDQDGFLAGDCLEDCDDNDSSVNAYASEILDGKDNNCNGQIDEGLEEIIEQDVIGDMEEPEEVRFFKKIFSVLFSWFN
ncbi:MAG: putative metal-binding motif-containing protein [Candidatus Woesearchaeota archaeon]